MKNLIALFLSLSFWQCARQSQPTGGPKDTNPPELISSVPTSNEKNFKGKTIELTFNEAIKLKDPQEEIVITPSAGTKTKFAAKKNKVEIIPELSWRDSTTYSIAFRGGIQDLNESNPADDLHLAFSTSSTIDSLQINGSVTEVFKDKIPEKITVALFQSDTFDIFLHKPTYFTKSSKDGKFSIQNLKPGRYFIYAFDDKNKNFKVDSKSERFGFQPQEINLAKNKDSIKIDLMHVDARPIKVTSVRNTSTISMIRFNKQLDHVKLQSDSNPFIYTYGDSHSELVLYKNFNQKDSLSINIFASDSSLQELDTAVYVKYTDAKKIDEKLKFGDWQVSFDPETKKLHATADVNKLLLSINYDSIYVQIDTSNYQVIKPSEISFDTLRKTIIISSKLNLETTENIPNPVLLFGKGAFVSIDKDSTKSQDVKINVPKEKDSGTLSVEVSTKEKHYEVLLLSTAGKIIKSFRDQKKYLFKYLLPAEYKLTIIVDSNNNNRWDSGNFYRKIAPEKVLPYKNAEGKYSFPIRANWEVGPLVITF